MIQMLHFRRLALDERRKAHIRRKLYNFYYEHSGDLVFFGIVALMLLFGTIVWYSR